VVGRYGRLDLFCLDELGYVQIDPRGAGLLFRILTEREERASIVIATNLPFSEWGWAFPDPRLVAAIVDGVTFNARILETGTQSYRLRTQQNHGPSKASGLTIAFHVTVRELSSGQSTSQSVEPVADHRRITVIGQHAQRCLTTPQMITSKIHVSEPAIALAEIQMQRRIERGYRSRHAARSRPLVRQTVSGLKGQQIPSQLLPHVITSIGHRMSYRAPMKRVAIVAADLAPQLIEKATRFLSRTAFAQPDALTDTQHHCIGLEPLFNIRHVAKLWHAPDNKPGQDS
jgi:hypothetical protein